jgi:hypothetical protein
MSKQVKLQGYLAADFIPYSGLVDLQGLSIPVKLNSV